MLPVLGLWQAAGRSSITQRTLPGVGPVPVRRHGENRQGLADTQPQQPQAEPEDDQHIDREPTRIAVPGQPQISQRYQPPQGQQEPHNGRLSAGRSTKGVERLGRRQAAYPSRSGGVSGEEHGGQNQASTKQKGNQHVFGGWHLGNWGELRGCRWENRKKLRTDR